MSPKLGLVLALTAFAGVVFFINYKASNANKEELLSRQVFLQELQENLAQEKLASDSAPENSEGSKNLEESVNLDTAEK